MKCILLPVIHACVLQVCIDTFDFKNVYHTINFNGHLLSASDYGATGAQEVVQPVPKGVEGQPLVFNL